MKDEKYLRFKRFEAFCIFNSIWVTYYWFLVKLAGPIHF